MALFNRRKDQTISELENYYANRNNRTGMAWLMALLSLMVTIAVVAGLFFGGRWVYRTLTNDDTTVVTTTSLPEEPTQNSSNPNSVDGANDQAVETPTNVEPNGVVSDEAVSTTAPSNSTNQPVAGVSTTTPTTGDSGLPNTGAGDLLIILPLIAGVLGYFYSRKQQLQK